MEAGALSKLFGDISVDESQINRENQEIAQGAQIPINTFDNHQAHVEGHTEFQKGPTYLGLGLFVNQAMEQHVTEHREQVLKQTEPPPHATPSESLAYKDAPPDIRRQIEAQAGMQPSHDESTQSVRHPQHPEPQGASNGNQGQAKSSR
jgi:hypothetical protein